MTPELPNKFIAPNQMRLDADEATYKKGNMRFNDNLLYVWSYFLKVAQIIYRDSAPLFKR
jgi:hypothetical protein